MKWVCSEYFLFKMEIVYCGLHIFMRNQSIRNLLGLTTSTSQNYEIFGTAKTLLSVEKKLISP